MKKDPEKGPESVFLDNMIHGLDADKSRFGPQQTPAIFSTRFHEEIKQKGSKIIGLFAMYRAETDKEEHLSQYSILLHLKEIKCHITDTSCTRLNELNYCVF